MTPLSKLTGAAALFVLAAGAWAGNGIDPSLWPEEIIDAMDGQRLVVFLPNQDIVSSPSWRPGDAAAPPLTVEGAIARLQPWLAQNEPASGLEIGAIELKAIKRHEQEHRWYYLFHLHPQSGERGKAVYVAVLFNGTVFPVIAEPSSIK